MLHVPIPNIKPYMLMWKTSDPGRSYSEKESQCEYVFRKAIRQDGPFWHLCTSGKTQEIFNTKAEDYRFSITNCAISIYEAGMRAVTDAHMENHLHGLLQGPESQCATVMKRYLRRLKAYLKLDGRDTDIAGLKSFILIPVQDLQTIRKEIAYINRNGFVADSGYLPYSYPWSGGCLFFNPFARETTGTPYPLLTYREKRSVCRARPLDLPGEYRVKDGMILSSSYLDYNLGESLFRDAHHYFDAITKNFEAFSEEARRLGDTTVLGREELYSAVRMLSVRDYNVKQPSLLPPAAKIELARKMHSDYHASNAQIRMILKMSDADVSQLFPLKALRR